jgi:hypothetical protein
LCSVEKGRKKEDKKEAKRSKKEAKRFTVNDPIYGLAEFKKGPTPQLL